MEKHQYSLTVDQARERARLLKVHSYDIVIDLTQGDEKFRSRTTVAFSASESGESTFIELRADSFNSIVLNGVELDLDITSNHIVLNGLAAENVLVVDANVPYVTTGDGLHRFVDPLDDSVYVSAYLGMDYAHHVFACFDQPDLKGTITLRVVAPTDWLVLGNGIPSATGEGHWLFATTPPISTYDFALVSGPLHQIKTEHRGIPFSIVARKSLAQFVEEQADDIFGVSTACFDQYLEMFDEPYPFDSYDSAFVPEFPWGAMESPGCVTFRDEYIFRAAFTEEERWFRALVIAHEMAHMWFGNLATMTWWDDTWLNESFAEYIGFDVMTQVPNYGNPWPAFAMLAKTWGSDADQRPTTHPVAPDPASVVDTETAMSNFDGISYAKGAAVLRQLAGWLGRDVFFSGVNAYLTDFQFSNATLADFVDRLAQASGRDVHTWATRWLETTGIDTIRATEVDGTVVVENLGTRPQHVSVALYDLDANTNELSLRRRTALELDREATAAASPLESGESMPSLVLLNDDDVSYSKIRLTDASRAVTDTHLSSLQSPVERAVLWTMYRDLVRDGEYSPADFVNLLATHLPAETHISIVDSLLRFVDQRLLNQFFNPTERPTAEAILRDACARIVAERQDDSSGIRLAAARSMVSLSAPNTDESQLLEWLEAGKIDDTLPLDADLRWRVLLRLSSFGAVTTSDIEAEAKADKSGSAEAGAPRCLGALPGAAAKELAWAAMFYEPDASNYIIESTGEGFWQPTQYEALAPYVDRYFSDALATTERRGSSVARALAFRAFPTHLASAATVEAGDALMSRGSVPEALERIWLDQLDDMKRGLHVQSIWSGVRK